MSTFRTKSTMLPAAETKCAECSHELQYHNPQTLECPGVERVFLAATEEGQEAMSANVFELLKFLGENPHREGLRRTPERVAKAWLEWCAGYTMDPADVLTAFEDGAEHYDDQMVTVQQIPFYSHCEHHLAPFFGTVTISYIPDKRIVGLSKLSRLTDIYAKRLQVQERMTSEIANALVEHLGPIGVGVEVRARHMCMESRGIHKQGHSTVTRALRGAIKDEPQTRAEFMALLQGG